MKIQKTLTLDGRAYTVVASRVGFFVAAKSDNTQMREARASQRMRAQIHKALCQSILRNVGAPGLESLPSEVLLTRNEAYSLAGNLTRSRRRR